MGVCFGGHIKFGPVVILSLQANRLAALRRRGELYSEAVIRLTKAQDQRSSTNAWPEAANRSVGTFQPRSRRFAPLLTAEWPLSGGHPLVSPKLIENLIPPQMPNSRSPPAFSLSGSIGSPLASANGATSARACADASFWVAAAMAMTAGPRC